MRSWISGGGGGGGGQLIGVDETVSYGLGKTPRCSKRVYREEAIDLFIGNRVERVGRLGIHVNLKSWRKVGWNVREVGGKVTGRKSEGGRGRREVRGRRKAGGGVNPSGDLHGMGV